MFSSRPPPSHGERISGPPMVMVRPSVPPAAAAEDGIAARFDAFVERMIPASWPRSWVTMSGYLAAGAGLGLFVILVMWVAQPRETEPTARPGVVSDNIVHLAGAQLPDPCWSGLAAATPSRFTVSMEVAVDGKVRSAVASGEGAAMRSCIEAHVKGWEFLPQAQTQQLVLPFEIAARAR